MLKLKLLAAATAAALFAVGGALAQTGTAGRSAATDKAPTAPSGPKEAGGSAPSFSAIDKNNDGMISRDEWNAYHRGAAAKAGKGAAASGATASGTDKKAPSATTGPRDVGGSDTAKAGAGATGPSGGPTGPASADKSADKAPTAPSGPKEAGGTEKKQQ
jgi:hypothetical protein